MRSILREKRSYKEYAVERNLTPDQLAREEKLLEEALKSGEGEIADDAWWDKLHSDVIAKVEARGKNTT